MIVFVAQVAVQLKQFVVAIVAIAAEVAGYVLPGFVPAVFPNQVVRLVAALEV